MRRSQLLLLRLARAGVPAVQDGALRAAWRCTSDGAGFASLATRGVRDLPCFAAHRAPARWLASAAGAHADVKIPSLGESISDGVICAVLKNVGDSVGVDETIAQIETDKVTVDIKAPSAGTLAEILVRKEDTVTVGQVIARVGPAQDGAGAGSGKERRKAQEHGADDRHAAGQDPSAPSSGATATPPRVEGGMHAHAAHAGRTPSLRFPPRVAPDGRRISDLPASEAAKYKEGAHGEARAPASAPPPGAAPRTSAPSSGAAIQVTSVGGVQTMYLDTAPPRLPLTDAEIEVVNLGGAMPDPPKPSPKKK